MNTKIMVISSAKTNNLEKRRPKLRFTGLWLNEIGFEHQKFISLESTKDNIVFRLSNKPTALKVKHETKNKKVVPCFEIKGFWMNNLGFEIGKVIVVQYDFEIIKLKVLDIEN